MKNKTRDTILGYSFLAVPLIINGIFLFYPIIYSFILSMFEWNLLKPGKYWVGFDNFLELFEDPIFLISIKNTLIYTLGVVPIQTIISMLMAVLLNQKIKLTFLKKPLY